MKRASRILAIATLSLTAWITAHAADSRASDPVDALQWLEAPAGERALAWAREMTASSRATLSALPGYSETLQALRQTLQSATPVADVALLGPYAVRLQRDAAHPRGLLQKADRRGETLGPWITVLDVGEFSAREHADYELRWSPENCLAPAFDRCLLSFGVGGGDAAILREFDLAAERFVENGFRLPGSLHVVAWLDRDTIVVGHDLGGARTTAAKWPAEARLWRRGTALAESTRVFEAAASDVLFQLHGLGKGRALLLQAVDFASFNLHVIDARGAMQRLALPSKLKIFGFQGATARHVFVQLTEATTLGKEVVPAETILSYDLDASDPSRGIEVVYTPRAGEVISSLGFATTQTRLILPVRSKLQLHLLEARHESTQWRVRPLLSAPAGVDVRASGDPTGEGLALAKEGFLDPPSNELLREDGTVLVLDRADPIFDATRFSVQVREARAPDGERIDYFLIAPTKRARGPIPTLITGYGGFGVSLSPAYPGSAQSQMYGGITLKLWFERGGALAIPAVRGGGERGSAWHRAAMGEHRQRAFDDLYAVATDLIHAGLTDSSHLGVFGTSNGGLLAGVAGLQRPDLFSAVVSDAPLTDMLRFVEMGMGAAWVGEYGDPREPRAAAWLKAYSPVHRVEANKRYPAFLITVSASDDRVGPGHARKLAKRLREVDAKAFFVETEAGGHAVSDPLLQPELMAMRVAFLLDQLHVGVEADPSQVQLRWNVRIPLRDGVELSAIAYVPREQQQPSPCVFTLTPYVAQTFHDRGVYFAAHGYPFLSIDVRGRGNSEGAFQPMIQEARDGYDIVEWLARQPYCNGKVAMWGGSYSGYNQWATAKEFPPHLATIVPAAAPFAGVDFPSRNNIFTPYDVQWLTYTSGRTAQERVFGDGSFWAAQHRRWFESGLSLRGFDTWMGNPSPIFQEWLNHPHPDAYWDRYNPTAAEYAKLRLPVLTITGSYDANQYGALTHYREHLKNTSAEGRAAHYLVIGPWDHSGTRTPKAEFGGLSFGPASLLDLPQLHLDWYAWTMGQGPKPSFLKKNVAYYVMGAETWRYADTLDAVTAERRPYYLASDGRASDVFSGGELGAGSRGGPDRYVYDPRDTGTAELESVSAPEFTDQRLVNARGGKQLVYHTAPFSEATEISGFFKLSAWIAIDQPDTDFAVNVYEVTADGSSILLSSDMMRARYRESFRRPTLIHTREPLRYDFERFSFVSRQVRTGSRLRLVISPLDSIYWEKNYNSGGEVAAETRADARPVTVTLYHDRAHPSALYVPIGQAEVTPGAFVSWARSRAISLEGFPKSEAERVGALVGSARMVSLGEPAHGAHEPLEFRNRLFQFLIEQHGFTAIALESGFNEARRVNEYVLGGEGDPREIAREGLTWGFGTLDENVELLRWVRQYNSAPGLQRKVRFYGIDLTGGDSENTFATSRLALDTSLAYLLRAAPELSVRARSAIEPFLDRFSLGGYKSLSSDERARLQSSIANVIALLESQRHRLVSASSEEEYQWALRSAMVSEQLETLFRLSPSSLSDGVVAEFHRAAAARDAAMADNALWALRREGTFGRVLLFAHNAHVMNGRLRGGLWNVYPEAPAMMGQHLRAKLGKDLVIVGASSGNAGTVDALLSDLGLKHFMLDLRAAPRFASSWLQRPQSLSANYTTEMEATPGQAFDAVVYFETLHVAR